MARWLVLIALLLSGVAHARTAKPVPAQTKSSKASKKKAVAKVKSAKKKSKKKKKEKKVPRVPDKTTNFTTNMPRGFHWPPTQTMKEASAICERQLDELGITWTRGEPEGRIVDPLVVPAMEFAGIKYTSLYRKGPHKLDCQLVRTLATFGSELFALGVREVKFGRIFGNTTVRVGGKSKNILSRHALGIAMDVYAVIDDAGREAVVKTDYVKDDPLLRSIEEVLNKSGRFRTVLTPRNDPKSHYDHFHIEAAIDYSAAELP